MFVSWGSGRAKCNICLKKIEKTKLQVFYRGYRQSAYCHLDCLIAIGANLIKERYNRVMHSGVQETLNVMKEFLKQKEVIPHEGELGTEVRESSRTVTPKVSG